MTKSKLILLVSLLLAACAHVPHNEAAQPDAGDQSGRADQPQQDGALTETPPAEAPAAEVPAAKAPMVLPNIEFEQRSAV